MTTRPGFSFCICPDGKLLRQQVEELLGAHPDAGRERHVFWGDDELPPKFWEILTLQGLFSTSRVLVMRNAHALTADVWKRLSAALSRPNPQTWPLFCLEVAWEKGQPKIPAHIAKLPCFTFADAKGWIWRSPGLEPRSLRRHIQIRSKALGLDLEPGCVDILAETLLPDAAAVDAELSKLQLLAGGKPLTQEQARSVSPTTEFNVFAFLRQLQAGRPLPSGKASLRNKPRARNRFSICSPCSSARHASSGNSLPWNRSAWARPISRPNSRRPPASVPPGSPSSGTPCTPPNFPSNREGAPPARRWMPSWAI
ncbi:MAG: DNA polymerase III subunit delta [Bilophila wadsworthia]